MNKSNLSEQIRELTAKGFSPSAIAKQLGCTRGLVYYYTKRGAQRTDSELSLEQLAALGYCTIVPQDENPWPLPNKDLRRVKGATLFAR
jgi:DNA-binding CsgD family transcriptional regulator